jgi:hypothetical protein
MRAFHFVTPGNSSHSPPAGQEEARRSAGGSTDRKLAVVGDRGDAPGTVRASSPNAWAGLLHGAGHNFLPALPQRFPDDILGSGLEKFPRYVQRITLTQRALAAPGARADVHPQDPNRSILTLGVL